MKLYYFKSIVKILENSENNKKQKELMNKTWAKYSTLSIEEIKTLLINRKWLDTITNNIESEVNNMLQRFATDLVELYERYEHSLKTLDNELMACEVEVNKYLKELGYEQ